MTRSKLSDQEKQEILSLFEDQQETIASLALRYEVSASTIRRLLKQPPAPKSSSPSVSSPSKNPSKPIKAAQLSGASSSATHSTETGSHLSKTVAPTTGSTSPRVELSSTETSSTELSSAEIPNSETPRRQMPLKRRDRIDSINSEGGVAPHPSLGVESSWSKPTNGDDAENPLALDTPLGVGNSDISDIIREISHEFDTSFTPKAITDDEDEDEDEDFEEEFSDLDDGDDIDLAESEDVLHLEPEVLLEVMPLSDAIFPKTCYLVIDRTAELVTRPLKDFGELGQIPNHEIQARTLPVFDNHRIARRFSHRTQRIIKVPNGNMIKATSAQLSAKGITRLLVNGRIYAL